MAQQHTTEFELQEALRGGGCALCWLSHRAGYRYLDSFSYESVNDPGLRNRLQASHGLCRQHAWALAGMRGSSLGVAIVYRDVLGVLEQAVQGSGKSGGLLALFKGSEEGTSLPSPSQPCPACEAEAEATQRYLAVLLNALDRAEVAQAFVAAGGLCYGHLRQAFDAAAPQQWQRLRASQLAVYEGLRNELQEFIRKNDYRFRDEGFGAEGDSWRRAVAAVVGLPWSEGAGPTGRP
ncbi:MAG: DUF6062 family protein [Caldilineales bacterium]|nr:DUF6062 family protein [Caldilineales bacterium]MDW8316732.1 DUF6062 family protein [Anaerolineae bacterium]